jgi:RHH-type transcriptional regulator, rel operon repressor / antitoxin RelB
MSMITLRINEEEKELFQKYADFNGVSLSEFIKSRVIESIEDEYDLKMIEEYEKRSMNKKEESYTLDEVLKLLGLEDEL